MFLHRDKGGSRGSRLAFMKTFADLLATPGPVLALAPMQDVTDLPFWTLISRYGGADVYFTEYFRVTPDYRPQKSILRSILENPTNRPAIAQIIGNDPVAMARTAVELSHHPVAAIDLNLGCPAPVVYRKCAGGGLLRDPERIHKLLGTLRSALTIPFTVKTRLGFSDPAEFDQLLDVFSRHKLDLLTVHGRTVSEKYGPTVHYDRIAQAVRELPFPILANGNVTSPANAREILEKTGARGLMIGRSAIRNPWIFRQIRDHLAGQTIQLPTGFDILNFIRDLYDSACSPDVPERSQVQKMKKYTNFIGEGISPAFLHDIRRCSTKSEFFAICARELSHSEPMSLDPGG